MISHQKSVHKNETEFLNRELLSSDLKFTCTVCEKKFVTETSLQYHLRKHESQKIEFLRKEAFEESENSYSCKLCYTKYKSFSNLSVHITSVHREETEYFNRELQESDLKFSCNLCEKKFITKFLLQSHLRKHESQKFEFLRKEAFDKSENRFTCKLCYTKYKYFSDLLAHTTSVHREETELLQRKIEANELVHGCSLCDHKFVSETLLDYHGSKCHNLSGSTTYCKLCDLNFKAQSGFMQHKYKIHQLELAAFKRDYEEKDRIYCCRICSKKCVTQISLNHHVSRKHGKKKIKVKAENQERYCQLCYIMYKEPKFLRVHQQRIHASELDAFEKDLRAEDMQHECTKCDKSFYSQNTLDYHMKRIHSISSGSEEFSCKLCYISFAYNSGLKKHLKVIHKDDMHLFEGDLDESLLTNHCQFCDKKFVSEHILRYHQKYQHKEAQETSSYCKLCYITFKFPSLFKNHKMTTHKDDMWAFQVDLDSTMLKHECAHCDLKFLSEHLLNYHTNLKHKELKDKLSYCKLCYVDFKFSSQLRAHKSKIHTAKEEIEAFSVKLEKSSLTYKCKFCKKRFLTKNILRYHNIYNHKEERRQDLNCEFCNKVFKWTHGRKKVMENHMKNLHNLEDYEVDDHEPVQKENDTVKNFMVLLNSLK